MSSMFRYIFDSNVAFRLFMYFNILGFLQFSLVADRTIGLVVLGAVFMLVFMASIVFTSNVKEFSTKDTYNVKCVLFGINIVASIILLYIVQAALYPIAFMLAVLLIMLSVGNYKYLRGEQKRLFNRLRA